MIHRRAYMTAKGRQTATATASAALRQRLFAVVARHEDGTLRRPTLTDTGAVLTIRLPHRLETPNAWLWSHWRTKKRAKDAWSERLRIACLSPAAVAMSIGGNVELASWIGWTAPTNRPIVRVTRQVPSRRNFITDRENRLFAAKALVDCLVQAGFLTNDREQDIDLQVAQVVSADGLDWTEIVIDARAMPGVSIDAHGVAWRGGKRLWTAAEDALLRARYADELTSAIARDLGRPIGATFQRALSLGLRKSEAYLTSPEARRLRHGDTRGAATRFKPGHVPANKGVKRGRGWAPGRMAVGQFKPGNANNWMPIGSRRDISGYVYIKMADVRHVCWNRNWFPEHILVWEMANGRQLPPGHAVAFRNGDRRDMRPDNLELITRQELMRRNSVQNLPKPIVSTIQLLGALKRQIRRRERHASEHR